MKVLIISHGHPELSAGGAERASYSLFQHLQRFPQIEPIFIARAEPRDIGHDGWFGSFRGRKDEFLWDPPITDWFRYTSQLPDVLQNQVRTIAEQFQPDIVHFHHYIFFGLDALGMFKNVARCGTVLTLHEYALICHHNGQMVKAKSLRLCHSASPAECGTCFPEFSSGKFFLREALIKQLLGDVDALISPSQFLRDRYVAWGGDEKKFEVIENLLSPDFVAQPRAQADEPTTKTSDQWRMRFGYFGQINPFKGTSVLLDALKYLSPETLDKVEIVLFGAHLEHQSPEFRESFQKQLSDTAAKVSFFGPYRNEDMPKLLSKVDWMVIPSIWWENSPLVIQEAKGAGIPILASNIGGMAEKVRDGVDGLHFLAGSAMDCASKIEKIVDGAVTRKPSMIDIKAQNSENLGRHLDLYQRLRRNLAVRAVG